MSSGENKLLNLTKSMRNEVCGVKKKDVKGIERVLKEIDRLDNENDKIKTKNSCLNE